MNIKHGFASRTGPVPAADEDLVARRGLAAGPDVMRQDLTERPGADWSLSATASGNVTAGRSVSVVGVKNPGIP